MLAFAIEGALALLVLIGSATIVWGVQKFHLPARVTAVAFAITAASWVALLVTMIGLTVITFIVPSA